VAYDMEVKHVILPMLGDFTRTRYLRKARRVNNSHPISTQDTSGYGIMLVLPEVQKQVRAWALVWIK
jgi:hypothetical protein